jgi:hypothetical protein
VNDKNDADAKDIHQDDLDNQPMEARAQNNNYYEIRVNGQLNNGWSDWLDGLNIELLENGDMIVFGRIQDQAALMGILNKLYRLNLALESFHHKQENNR